MKAVVIAVLAALLAGCTFHRSVTNAYVRDIDTSWIRPGETTFFEVVDRIGLPPMIQGVNGYTSDALHYVCLDSFEGKFEAGYIVTPTFSRAHESDGEDILITFDDAGVVQLVSRTRMKRTPVEGGQSVEVLEYRGVLK